MEKTLGFLSRDHIPDSYHEFLGFFDTGQLIFGCYISNFVLESSFE